MLNPNDITGQMTLQLHLQRYEFAAKHLKSGRVLDIACGVGYGTHFIADNVTQITEAIGVDICEEAIQHAILHYSDRRVQFHQHDAMTFTDDIGYDSIVSLETLEHVSEPATLIKHLYELLRSEGMFIASVPTTPGVDVNRYHFHDFTERSFRNMVRVHGFTEIASLIQVQPYPLMKTLRREESRMQDMRQDLVSYYLHHPKALAKRLWSTLRYGFTNRFLTVAWKKRS
jgi:cyclopropane fatty-acyl-phospholipid synthase-like methyltransferase